MRLTGKPAGLSGHLGRFHLTFDTPNGNVDLKAATGGWREHFDLVLDLTRPPLIDAAIPPVGYYASGNAPSVLEAALAELPTLVGEFVKPQYFQYDASICAHSRSGVEACTRCIDTCPAEAIKSIGGIEKSFLSCPRSSVTPAQISPKKKALDKAVEWLRNNKPDASSLDEPTVKALATLTNTPTDLGYIAPEDKKDAIDDALDWLRNHQPTKKIMRRTSGDTLRDARELFC